MAESPSIFAPVQSFGPSRLTAFPGLDKRHTSLRQLQQIHGYGPSCKHSSADILRTVLKALTGKIRDSSGSRVASLNGLEFVKGSC